MDFELDGDQTLLARSVADFVAKESPVARARRLRDDPIGWEPATFRQMGELGFLGVAFPAEVGGFGGSMIEAAIVLERFGATLVPEPYVASVLLAGSVVLEAGDAAQREELLVPMLEGRSSLALAYAEEGARHGLRPRRLVARRDGADYVLSGEKRWVLNGHAADALVVTAWLGGETALFVVDREAPGVALRSVRTIDGRRAAMLRLENARVPSSRRLALGDAEATLERALDLAATGAVAEGLGGARTMLAATVEHLRTRQQFGRLLGSFQALQHRAAQMYIETELLASSSTQAMVRATDPDPDVRRRAVSAAKAQLAESGTFVARQTLQLHGGIGMTDEHDVGLFFKRQLALEALFGDAEHHLARFASLPSFGLPAQG